MHKSLKTFLLQSAFWTALCYGSEAFCRFALHWGGIYTYPTGLFIALFADYRGFFWKFAFWNTPTFFATQPVLPYPAPMLFFYEVLLRFPGHSTVPRLAVVRFLGLIFVTLLVMLWVARRALVRRRMEPRQATIFVAGLCLMSFPMLFEIHQLNMEFILWVVVTLGIWAFWTDRLWTSSVFFGLAIAMKIFPFVFLGLYLGRKRYGPMLGAIGITVVTTLFALRLEGPDLGENWRQTVASLATFQTGYMLKIRPLITGFDHSLFAAIKLLPPSLPNEHMLSFYLAAVAIGGIALFFLRILKLPLANQILCLSIAAVLLPPTSYDYTLIHLYAPLMLLAFAALERRKNLDEKPLMLAFALLAFILSAQEEFIAHGVRFAAQLKAGALLLLWIVALIYPVEVHRAEDPERESQVQRNFPSRNPLSIRSRRKMRDRELLDS